MKIQWFCENIHAISGYSDEARAMVRGLIDRGHDVKIVGKNTRPGKGEFTFQSGISRDYPVVFHTFRHGLYSPGTGAYGIARTMLEVSRVPENWVYRLNRLQEIWVPNLFNLELFARSGVDPDRLFVIPSPVVPDTVSSRTVFEPKTRKNFVFLSLFNYSARYRKGLDVLLKAYTETFGKNDDVCLVIKSNTTRDRMIGEFGLSGDGPEIRVINEVLDQRNLMALFRWVDCYVMPSRGEGIGRPYLEALGSGLPVIATGWGGHRDFLNDRNALLIKYQLKDVGPEHYLRYPGFYGSQWAEPDIRDLKRKMIQVIDKHFRKAEKREQAFRLPERYGIDQVCRRIIERLSDPLPARQDGPRDPNLFERLFPIYYPHMRTGEDVYRLNRQAFDTPVESVGILGTGPQARRVFQYIGREMGVPNILFIDERPEGNRFLNRPFRRLSGFSPVRDPVDLIVMGVRLQRLEQMFNRLINQVDSLPVYCFD